MAKAKCDECLKQIRTLHDLAYRGFSEADFLCNDCEKYVCSKCITKHVGHFTFALKDKSNKTKLDRFSEEIIKELTSEGDQTLEKFTEERTHICDIVDVVGEEMRPHPYGGTSVDFSVKDICILRESKKWAITDCYNQFIKVFNINNNHVTRTIHFKYEPYGIAEVPSTDPSQSLIAVSFPYARQIDIVNINSEPPVIISSTNVQDQCLDLAYCNNKLITRCAIYLDREGRYSIHVMDMTGEIINIIDLNNLPGTQRNRSYLVKMCVHSESETIYLCHYDDPPCVLSLSLDGQALHYVEFTDMEPRIICVDRDQTVYVMDDCFPLYKLSSDLSQTENIKGSLYKWLTYTYSFTSIACHADMFYLARSGGRVCIIRHE